MSCGCSCWWFLDSNIIHKRQAIIWCWSFCSSCFEGTEFEVQVSDTFDPSHCCVVYKACSAVEVVNGCLYVDFSFVALKACWFEVNCLALHIGGVHTESNASSFKNESWGITNGTKSVKNQARTIAAYYKMSARNYFGNFLISRTQGIVNIYASILSLFVIAEL